MRRPNGATGFTVALAVALLASAPARAEVESVEGFDVPVTSLDYRADYAFAAGIWREGQTTLRHRVRFQFPLWAAGVGAQFSFSHAVGEVNQTVAGNLRVYAQYFHTFEWSRRASFTLGGGVDGYVPTATGLEAQSDLAALVAGPSTGDVSLGAPDLSFALRPRLHLGAQAWIFTVQLYGATAVHFVGDRVRAAFEWGAHVSAAAGEWVSIVGEVSGASWLDQTPAWTTQRSTNVLMGLRLTLPGGWMPGLYVRVPASGNQTDHGEGIFVGAQLVWRHR